MTERVKTEQRELDDLFERYRSAPKGHVFAPLADACRKAGMIEEALEICAKGVGLHPRYASGYVVQGKCLYDAGRARDAQAAFNRVLELDPKNLVALKFLGIISAERGESLRAKEYFEHILALDPDDREIRSRMEDVTQTAAKAAPRRHSAPAAEPVLQPIVATEAPPEETTPETDDAITLPDLEDESFEGAPITLRDEAVISDEIATITLADIYASQGYTTRALKIYREVSKRQPDSGDLAVKIARLEKIELENAPAPVEEAPAAPSEERRPAHVARESASSERTVESRAAAQPPLPPPVPDSSSNPMDPARSYEQFKRWLKTTSR